MSILHLACLGRFQATFGQEPLPPFRTSKVQALLVYLAVEASHHRRRQAQGPRLAADPTQAGLSPRQGSGTAVIHRRETLMELLWPNLPLKSAQDNLRQTLYQLRKSIPGQQPSQQAQEGDGAPLCFITSTRLTASVNPAYRFDLDVSDFSYHLGQGNLEAAVALYRGDFLEDFYLSDSNEFETWVQLQRSAYRRQILEALDTLAAERLSNGQYASALEFARQQLQIDALRERAHRLAMEAQARLGQREAALAQYELCRQRLSTGLGVDPSQETDKLFTQILRDEIRATESKGTIRMALFPEAAPGWAKEQETPLFVGREKELAILRAIQSAAGAGQGSVQFVAGSAGRGKTALVTAFARRALDADPGLLLLSGHCRGPMGTGEPYLPLRQILAQLTGNVSRTALLNREQAYRLWSSMADTIPLLVEKGADLIDTLVPGAELRQRAATIADPRLAWFAQLCRHLDDPAAESPRQDRIFSQVTAVLKAVAATRSLLLIIDDLHWADAATASLLVHLSFELPGSRILLLCTYRPEEVYGTAGHTLAPILSELKRRFGDVFLDLGQQSAAEGRAFVDAYLDSEPNDLDERFRRKLAAHTGGHALFTVELLRAMQQRGELYQVDLGPWQAKTYIDWHTFPARVEGVIEQRFGRLDPELRSALAVAAVEGESFTAEIVAEIRNLSVRELVHRLSQEAEGQHRLVQAAGVEWHNGQRLARYHFRHQLFQQFLYQELDEIERTYLHETIGFQLETLSLDRTKPSALAWHFDHAKNKEKAIPYLLQAGDAARLLYASQEAIDYYERALAHLKAMGDYEQAERVLLKLGLTHMNAFDSEAARIAFEASFALRREVAAQAASANLATAPHALRLIVPPHTPWFDPTHVEADDFGFFPGLVQLTMDLDVVPDMAWRWDILDNGHTYIFHLRDNVFWSDGHPVTMEDYVCAWHRALNPHHGSPYATMLYDIVGAAEIHQGSHHSNVFWGVEALDGRTLRVRLTQPNAHFLHVMTQTVATPVPKHLVEQFGDEWSDPKHVVSCGPFLLHSLENESINLCRNHSYYGQFPGNIEYVNLRFSKGRDLAQYLAGELDAITLWPLPPQEFQHIIQQRADEYWTGPALQPYGLRFDVQASPFDDPRVRRAFVMAVDRKSMAEVYEAGRGFPATGGFVPPGITGHVRDIGLPYNPDRARQLLAAAGYPDGRDFPCTKALLSIWDVPRIPEFVFQSLTDVLKVKFEWQVIPWASYFEEIARQKPQIICIDWIADYPDPDSFLRVGINFLSNWRHTEYVALISAARRSTDHEHRLGLFRQAEEILIREAPILPLLYLNQHFLVKKWIKNFYPKSILRTRWHKTIIEPH